MGKPDATSERELSQATKLQGDGGGREGTRVFEGETNHEEVLLQKVIAL